MAARTLTATAGGVGGTAGVTNPAVATGGTAPGRAERRVERDRTARATAAEARIAEQLGTIRPTRPAVIRPPPVVNSIVSNPPVAVTPPVVTNQWGGPLARRFRPREENATFVPIQPRTIPVSPSRAAVAATTDLLNGRFPPSLMGGTLPDGQLPPEVRRQIMQSRQEPAERGEGPSVGPTREAVFGDGSGDDMIIG